MGGVLFNYIVKNNMEFDYLTYVPRDRNKIKKEGFDQSYFLCKFLGIRLGIPFLNAVYCKGKEHDQKYMNVADRKVNVNGKFFASKHIDRLNNKSVLIVDDVVTTCSTINEVVRVIKKSSSKTRVSVLTIAKTLI